MSKIVNVAIVGCGGMGGGHAVAIATGSGQALWMTDGSKDPLQVEKQLRQVLPPEESNNFCHRMVLFGRDTCTARSPKCEGCPLAKDCDTAKAAK